MGQVWIFGDNSVGIALPSFLPAMTPGSVPAIPDMPALSYSHGVAVESLAHLLVATCLRKTKFR